MNKAVRRALGAIAIAGSITVAAGCSSSDSSSTTTTVAAPAASTVDGLFTLGRPVVLGHAGGEDVAPHSTMYAFAESVRAGVDILDIDIQRTKDGVLIVQHDDTTKRTTETNANIADLTYAQVNALDNGYWFSKTCGGTCTGQADDDYIFRGIRTGAVAPPAGYSADDFAVVKFSDVAERWPDYVLNIEIKGKGSDAYVTAQLLADEIARLGRTDSTVVTSFEDDVVNKFHEFAPKVRMSPGLNVMTAYVLAGGSIPTWENILQVPPEYQGIKVFDAAFVEKTKADGLFNWVWPNGVDEDVAGYMALFTQGADGINASDPFAGVEALKQFEAQ